MIRTGVGDCVAVGDGHVDMAMTGGRNVTVKVWIAGVASPMMGASYRSSRRSHVMKATCDENVGEEVMTTGRTGMGETGQATTAEEQTMRRRSRNRVQLWTRQRCSVCCSLLQEVDMQSTTASLWKKKRPHHQWRIVQKTQTNWLRKLFGRS